ncbi:MAG: hypothetical protein PHE24_05915, partial [Patescibacteria group bacterium]|nr:hypothetical protein [Patescibacteria group bacterium]
STGMLAMLLFGVPGAPYYFFACSPHPEVFLLEAILLFIAALLSGLGWQMGDKKGYRLILAAYTAAVLAATFSPCLLSSRGLAFFFVNHGNLIQYGVFLVCAYMFIHYCFLAPGVLVLDIVAPNYSEGEKEAVLFPATVIVIMLIAINQSPMTATAMIVLPAAMLVIFFTPKLLKIGVAENREDLERRTALGPCL